MLAILPTLQQVITAGGLTNSTNIIQGPLGGIALICTINLILEWFQGALYSLDSGNLINKVQFKTISPNNNDDSTKNYKVGSYWEMNDGKLYRCTDNSVGEAVWMSESTLSLKGQNYVIVQSVNTGDPLEDSLINGINLLNGLANLDSLNWGTRSRENMGSLILMPGTYRLVSTTIEMINFINIIGFSENNRDTVITGSGMINGYRQINWADGITAGLKNVELIADVANNSIMLGGAGTASYPIVENISMGSDNMFYSNSTELSGNPGFDYLNGEWKNIKFLTDSSHGFNAPGHISAIIENVEFKNITFDAFFSYGTISGKFKNIKVGNCRAAIASRFGDISIELENFSTKNLSNVIECANGELNGEITNFTTGTVAGYSVISISCSPITIIRNFVTSGGFFSFNPFVGKIFDSTFNSIGKGYDSFYNLGNGSVIERCKFLCEPGFVSINKQGPFLITAQILYTVTNNGINSDISIPLINYNINNSSLI